jgi:hypothetical protein
MVRRWLLAAILVAALGGVADAQEFSGMAPLGARSLLYVSDTKADRAGPRVWVLTFSEEGAWSCPVAVDWGAGDPASDLEAACAVPGQAGLYLLAEGGYHQGRFGRVFLVRLVPDLEAGWRGRVEGSFRPFPAPPGGTSPGQEQIEGMACLAGDGGLLLLLGLRGSPSAPARLVWGRLELEGPTFVPEGSQEFSLQQLLPASRSCADLAAVPGEGGWRIYSVASTDPADRGPFASVVAEVGLLSQGRFQPAPPVLLGRLDGLKVEALCPTPPGLGLGGFCVGTDDEIYGGVWRPLPPP